MLRFCARAVLFAVLLLEVATASAQTCTGPVAINYSPITPNPKAISVTAMVTGSPVEIQNPPTAYACQKVGGYLWYIGNSGDNCTTVCASHGGYNNATRTYAGSDGTFENCQTVATQFGYTNFGSSLAGGAVGCFLSVSANVVAHRTNTTTESASVSGAARFCACNS